MHKDFQRADEWSRRAIGAAIEVHRDKGPGLVESIYEKCFLFLGAFFLNTRFAQGRKERKADLLCDLRDLLFDTSFGCDVAVPGTLRLSV